jgi:hypothetical protein
MEATALIIENETISPRFGIGVGQMHRRFVQLTGHYFSVRRDDAVLNYGRGSKSALAPAMEEQT